MNCLYIFHNFILTVNLKQIILDQKIYFNLDFIFILDNILKYTK